MLTDSEVAVAPLSYARASRRAWVIGTLAFVLFLVLAVGYCLTRRPWWDEGLFADVALNFRNHGRLGSIALDEGGYLWYPQVHTYTFWQFPLYFVALGSWLRLVPTTIVWMRFFSVFCGCIYLLCWFLLVRKLSRNEALAIWVTAFLALNFEVLSAAADARMEMMCATFGQLALAAYFYWEDSNWERAAFVAACFGTAALFSHPMGVLINLVLVIVVLLNRRRIRWRGLAAAIIPYLVGGALFLAYIMQAPHVFAVQLRSDEGIRVGGLMATINNALNDFYMRYLARFWTDVSTTAKIKVFELIFPLVGLLAVAIDQRLRNQRLGRVLLILSIASYSGVALIDNQKFALYLIYTLPPMTACGAVWVYSQWRERGRFRFIAAGLAAIFLFVSSGSVAYKIHYNAWKVSYSPMIATVRAGLPPGGLVIGGSELGFALGFGPQLVDDRYAGVITGRVPDVFVTNECYGIIRNADTEKSIEALQARLKNDYHLVLVNDPYHVYFLNKNSPLKSSR
jgi:hypothetical protein